MSHIETTWRTRGQGVAENLERFGPRGHRPSETRPFSHLKDVITRRQCARAHTFTRTPLPVLIQFWRLEGRDKKREGREG